MCRSAPKPYSKVTLSMRRSSEEDAAGGTFLADTYGVAWRHGFTERLDLDTGIDYTVADFDGSPPQTDKYLGFRMKVTHELTRWLDVGASYRYLNRRSNVADRDYDDHIVMIELTAGFERGLAP